MSDAEELGSLASIDILILYVDDHDTALADAIEAGFADGQARIVVIHADSTEPAILSRLRGQSQALLSESDASTMLVSTLKIVGSGYNVFAQGEAHESRPFPSHQSAQQQVASRALAAAPAHALASKTSTRLSQQEIAILKRLPSGWSNKEIARDLQISEATVKVHLRAIFRKLSVPNRTLAALWSVSNLAREGPDEPSFHSSRRPHS